MTIEEFFIPVFAVGLLICLSYFMHMNFHDKSFWERMVSARLIKQELSLYAKSGVIIDLDSKQLTVFRLIEKLMSFSILPIILINRILHRFR